MIHAAKPDFEQLCQDILSEAKSSTGTWCLATYSRVDDAVHFFQKQEVANFLNVVIARITSPDAVVGERFKLVQLCTMIRQKRGDDVKDVFASHRAELLGVKDSIQKEGLGTAVMKLINSLYAAPREKVSSQSPPGSLDRRALPHIFSRRLVYAKTPTI